MPSQEKAERGFNMSRRLRKKQLKKLNKYVNPRECWNLDVTIAEWIIPRLEQFKKDNNGYPGCGEMDTFEKWQEAIQKMIDAFVVIRDWDEIFYDDKYFSKGGFQRELWNEDFKKYNKIIEEGMLLFAKYIQQLWW